MASSIGDIRSKVTARIQDDAGKLSTTAITGDVDLAIYSALEQYEKARPREVVDSVDGDGGFDYLVSAFSPAFVEGFSVIDRVVYPFDATDQGFGSLDPDGWELIRLPAGLTLRFLEDTPLATEAFLVFYTVRHTLDGATSTVNAADDEALADLGAAEALEMLAAFYAQNTDGSIAADAVDHRSQAREYRDLAAVYRKRYREKIGGAEAAAVPAGAIVELDRTFGDADRTDYFFHGRRRF